MDPTNELADRKRAEALGSGGAIKDSGTPSPSLDDAHRPNPRLMQPADVARPQASQRSPEESPLPTSSGPGPMADTNDAIAAGGEVAPVVPVDAAGKPRDGSQDGADEAVGKKGAKK